MPLTKLNNKAVANVTALPVALGDMVLVSSATASSSASIEFSLGNYKEYVFYFVNCHPSTNAVSFLFNLSTDSGSNYNVTKTTTFFRAFQSETGSSTGLGYQTGSDLAQSTSFQELTHTTTLSNDSDSGFCGSLTLFNPSSTTYVKHFISRNQYTSGSSSINVYVAGYGNTTSAINAIKFQMDSGNIDAGKILMFGVN